MSKYIVCPDKYKHEPGLPIFMAGGITGCPDWQTEVSKFNFRKDIVLINPRRADFDCSKAESSNEQIQWEFEHLKKSSVVVFWFPKEGLCSITLFELGWAIGSGKVVRVGVEPGYVRELDVREQTKLRVPGIKIYQSLKDLYFPYLEDSFQNQGNLSLVA